MSSEKSFFLKDGLEKLEDSDIFKESRMDYIEWRFARVENMNIVVLKSKNRWYSSLKLLKRKYERNVDCASCIGHSINLNSHVFKVGVSCMVGVTRRLYAKYVKNQEEQDQRDNSQMNLPFDWQCCLSPLGCCASIAMSEQIKPSAFIGRS